MDNLIPILLILIFFGISFFGIGHINKSFRIFMALGLMTYFLAMFFIDSSYNYSYLFFAFVALFIVLATRKSSGFWPKSN